MSKNIPHSSFHIPHSRRASALIFTLLIVGLVASLSFFVGRSAVREVRIVNADQNSLGAYYAAEAGLEDGLARLAADINLEVPTCYFGQPHAAINPPETVSSPCNDNDIQSNDPRGYPTNGFNSNLSVADLASAAPQSFPSRVRVAQYPANSSGAQTSNNSTACTPQPACKNTNNLNLAPYLAGTSTLDTPATGDFAYDLKITSQIKNFGPSNAAGDPTDPTAVATAFIAKDSYREFSLYTTGTNQPDELDYWWTCQTPNPDCNVTSKILIFSITRPVQSGGSEPVQDITRYGFPDSGNKTILFSPTTYGAVSKVRIKAIGDGAYLSVVFKNTTTLPAHHVFFKGDIARLQSIGYHAGIKRRLEADVDRRSGGLLGLFDYAVYAGSSFTQPTQ